MAMVSYAFVNGRLSADSAPALSFSEREQETPVTVTVTVTVRPWRGNW
jgi:hypothetical protein